MGDTEVLKGQEGFLVREELMLDPVMLWGWPEQRLEKEIELQRTILRWSQESSGLYEAKKAWIMFQ